MLRKYRILYQLYTCSGRPILFIFEIPCVFFHSALPAKNVIHFLWCSYFPAAVVVNPNELIIVEKHFVILPKTNLIYGFIVTTVFPFRSSYFLPHATCRIYFLFRRTDKVSKINKQPEQHSAESNYIEKVNGLQFLKMTQHFDVAKGESKRSADETNNLFPSKLLFHTLNSLVTCFHLQSLTPAFLGLFCPFYCRATAAPHKQPHPSMFSLLL